MLPTNVAGAADASGLRATRGAHPGADSHTTHGCAPPVAMTPATAGTDHGLQLERTR